LKIIRFLFEYGAMRLLWLLLAVCPLARAYSLGQRLGLIWYACDRRRRGIARENVLRSGLAADCTAAAALARTSFGHFLGHLIESLRLPAAYARFDRGHIETDLPDESLKLLTEPGEPVLLVSGHLGCWETALRMFPATRQVMVVARPMNNPYVQRFLDRTHFRGKIELISKKRGLSPEVIRRWGEGRTLVLLMDQHAGRHGVWIDFLGRPAATHTSPARLHLMTGYPIVCIAFVRVGLLRYRLIAGEPIRFVPTGDRDADQRAILTELTRRLETFIRCYPEQYLWAHRRWRQPPAAP